MFKGIITNAVVCGKEGGDTEHPIRIYEGDEFTVCSFWVGISVYDTKAPNKQRYTNWLIKAFGKAAEHVKILNLKKGSRINLLGELDQSSYEGTTGTRIIPFVKISEWNDIEILFSGERKSAEEKEKPKEMSHPAKPEPDINLDQNDPFLETGNGIIFD